MVTVRLNSTYAVTNINFLFLQQRALLEQQEMRRQQKEQAERERLRQENERRREREEEDALDKVRKTVGDQQGNVMTATSRAEEVKAIVDTDSSSPSHSSSQDKAAAERERQRLREQERRRREAVSVSVISFPASFSFFVRVIFLGSELRYKYVAIRIESI